MIHSANAYNQNKENNSGSIYSSTVTGNYTSSTNGGIMYKSMQFVYAGRKLDKGIASFLFFSDQFSKYQVDSSGVSPVKTFSSGAWARATTGFYLNNVFGKFSVITSAFYQFGKTNSGQKLSAGLLSGSLQYSFSKKYSAG